MINNDPLFALINQEEQRQQQSLELIASENFVSPAVLAAQGSVLTNKYAEGYYQHRYYGGCKFIDEVEMLAITRAQQLFGVTQPWFSRLLKPVFTLTLTILRVQDVPAGTPVGYGSTVTATRPLRIATISAGYADGVPRNMRPPAGVCWRGVRLPVLGRVCMDSFMVDASAVSPTAGDVVEFIGTGQTLEEVAAACDTIPYEIMTRLGARFQRIMQPAGV